MYLPDENNYRYVAECIMVVDYNKLKNMDLELKYIAIINKRLDMLLLTVCSLGQCQKEKQNIPVHHVFSTEMAP